MIFLKAHEFRLIMGWLVVTVGLSNHDLFLVARQPLHFTRGYEWTALFLMGAPIMVSVTRSLLTEHCWKNYFVAGSLVALMLLDNAVWFGWRTGAIVWGAQGGGTLRMSADFRDVLSQLRSDLYAHGLVISDDPKVAYFVIVYTPLRTWYSHVYNTPFAAKRKIEIDALFKDGVDLADWKQRKMVVVTAKRQTRESLQRLLDLGYHLTYENGEWIVLLRNEKES
jgi:hypothetical protein